MLGADGPKGPLRAASLRSSLAPREQIVPSVDIDGIGGIERPTAPHDPESSRVVAVARRGICRACSQNRTFGREATGNGKNSLWGRRNSSSLMAMDRPQSSPKEWQG